MKRAILALLYCVIFVITMQGQYVTIEGRQFKDGNGDDFYPVVCNYIVGYLYSNDTNSFFLSPESDAWGYECNGASTCDTQFYHNFLQLKHMNFNCIRLFGATPVYIDTLNGSRAGFRIDATHNLNGFPDSLPRHQYFLNPPYENDSVTQKMFTLIDRILIQANHAGLKVILLSGGAKGRFYPILDTTYYPEFLSALSHHITNHSPQEARNSLMAYDLFNEPGSSDQMGWPWSVGHYKKNVCNRVSNWYNAIRINDPSHLITMGAGGVDDILEYDLSVMKLDFASPHFYPKKSSYEPDSIRLEAMIKRGQGFLYWLEKNSQMPFIIGENGFSAQENVLPNAGTLGDTSEQRQYAERILQLTRDCLGSGYSWWKYQNSYWGNSIYEDSFGLLNGGVCTPPCNALEKPVVKAFENFNALDSINPSHPPDNYFDPWNHELFSLDTNRFRGHVRNFDNQQPIKDVVVFARTLYKINQAPADSTYDYSYTFTDSLGNFIIRPLDSIPQILTDKVRDLYISGPGSERLICQAGNPYAPLVDNSVYNLVQKKWNFDGVFKNDTIHSNEVETLQGWHSLSLSGLILETGSNVTFNARQEIIIDCYFEALVGSEAKIECIPTFPICMDYDGFLKKITTSQPELVAYELDSEIELSFLSALTAFNFTVFPNPGNGNFTVNVNVPEIDNEDLKVEIVNFLGINFFNMSTKKTTFGIDISSSAKGIYVIKISRKSDSQVQKIIIQ